MSRKIINSFINEYKTHNNIWPIEDIVQQVIAASPYNGINKLLLA